MINNEHLVDRYGMQNVSAITVADLGEEVDGLAGVPQTADNACPMAEHPQTTATGSSPEGEEGPNLRLAGTPAGEPSEQEQKMLQLRKEMVLVLSAIEQDAGMIGERLARSGRIDPIQEVTGVSALDSATRNAEGLIQAIDAMLLDVAGEVALHS